MHLVAEEVAFAYPGWPVLAHVNLRVSAGHRVGLVGENGTGKTTLLRILAGDLAPASGYVRRIGTLAVVEQELVPRLGQTVGNLVNESLASLRAVAAELEAAAEAVASGTDAPSETGSARSVDRSGPSSDDWDDLAQLLARAEHLAVWDADRRVEVALARLGACRDRGRKLADLSVGERYRVRLACRLAERADLLLLDEPTNHLDAAGIEFLTGELLAWRGAVVMVTHDRQLLDDVVTEILDLDPSMTGVPVLYGQPGYLSYRFTKNQALHRWRQRYRSETKRAEALAARLDDSYEGLSDEWRPAKGSQKHRRATHARIHVKAADRLIERLLAEAVEVPVPPPEFVFPELPAMSAGWDPGMAVVELRHPRVGSASAPRLDLPGTRVAIGPSGRLLVTGPNGSGKSTLLAALAGAVVLDRGHRTVVPSARIGVVAQEGAAQGTSDETGFDAYAREALALLSAGRLDPDRLVPIAGLGLLSEENLDRPLGELSAGQRRRFDLAVALLAMPHLLILDEPTNHLSIDLVDDLTRALQVTPAAVVVATHDRRMQSDFEDWPRLELG